MSTPGHVLPNRSAMSCLRLLLGVLFSLGICLSALGQSSAGHPSPNGIRTATDFPGASIVERIQAAILDCGAAPCQVYVPAGDYQASPISHWMSRNANGRIGVLLPSNIELFGAGQGHTVIRVTRAAGDPAATLLTNANELNRNLRLHDMTIVYTDAAKSWDWVSIFLCHGCSEVELDHLTLEGNPNKLVNLLDSSGSRVHDNTFLLHSTGYGHGDNAITFSRFDPKLPAPGEAGSVRDNTFRLSGDYKLHSILIASQSGLYVHSNLFEAPLQAKESDTAIESGADNLGELPERIKISGNIFHGTSIAFGGEVSSEISNNFIDHGNIYIALQSGTKAALALLTIADNEVHFGSIGVNGLEQTFTGRCIITRNRVFDGGIGVGNSLLIRDFEVSYNTVKYSNNRSGIDCNACSVVRGNLVTDIGQNGPGDLHPGFLIGGIVEDASDNIYVDDQHQYEAGTVCSTASPTSRDCMSSGRSRWILLKGGEWGFGWGNRTLFTAKGNLLIRAFLSNSVLELDSDTDALPVGTTYHLYRTTFNGFELNAATITRFANNVAISTTGPFSHAAIQEDNAVSIGDLFGNTFRPYKCFGKCSIDYRANTSTPQ